MKKKTLVSVLAMTSASMAAYANANLDQIKTEVDQWVGAEKPSLVNGVLTSPNGTTISQSLGSLLPGTYKLSATTLMNAKFLVNGKALTNGEFKVEGTAASEVTLAIEAVETGKEFRVGGFKLELVFDFAGAQRTLLNAASKAIAKVSQEDDADKYAEFNKRYSDLTVKINRVKDDAAGDFALIRCMVSISFTSMAWKEVHSCQRSRHLIRISRRIWPTGELIRLRRLSVKNKIQL